MEERRYAPTRLIETVVEVNDRRKKSMAAKVVQACGGSVAGKRIALLIERDDSRIFVPVELG